MPFPLAAIGVAVATAVANGAILLLGKSKIKREQESYDSRLREFRTFEKHYKRKITKLEARFEVLGKRKLQSLNTMKLAVDFIKKARIRDRDLEQLLQITQQRIEVWDGVTVQATEVIGGLSKSLGAGTATGVAIYGAVGAYGTASTGTAISGLSGAAAKSATLAWFGGGSIASGGGGVAIGSAVLGGVVAVPSTLVTGFFVGNKVQKVKTEVEKKKSEMDIAQAQMVRQIDVTKIALKRIDELYDSIEKTEIALETLVTNSDPADLDDVYRVAQTAKTLGELLDVVITDKNGKLIVNHNQ